MMKKNNNYLNIVPALFTFCCLFFASSCTNNSNTSEIVEESPTSGNLNVYYDEGLTLHVKNQVYTFEALYSKVNIKLFESTENESVQALYNDSCEAIVISRLLTASEKKAFASKGYDPKYTPVAKSGIALITNIATPLDKLSYEEVLLLLSKPFMIKDSTKNDVTLNVLFDKNNSAVLHYMMDSVLKAKQLSVNCNILNSTQECINYVAKNKNTIGFIDFAWLSDVDDSIYKANKNKIKILGVSKQNTNDYKLPDQSNFKLNNYPFTRTVYVLRKTGDYTIAKGFQSFISGPKGQLTFLKQGLLPARQSERAVKIKMEP